MVCEAVEEYAEKKAKEAAKEAAIKATIEDAVSYGMDKETIVKKLNEKYSITKEEAEKMYDTYAVQ